MIKKFKIHDYPFYKSNFRDSKDFINWVLDKEITDSSRVWDDLEDIWNNLNKKQEIQKILVIDEKFIKTELLIDSKSVGFKIIGSL